MQVTWAIREGQDSVPGGQSPKGPASGPDWQRTWDEKDPDPPTLYKATGSKQCDNEIRTEKGREAETGPHIYHSTDFQQRCQGNSVGRDFSTNGTGTMR